MAKKEVTAADVLSGPVDKRPQCCQEDEYIDGKCLACLVKLMPPWTSTQPKKPSENSEGYMVAAKGLTPARLPGVGGQRRIGMVPDDRSPNIRVEVSVPHLPYQWWITDAGNIEAIVCRTNRVHDHDTGKLIDDGNYSDKLDKHYYNCGYLKWDSGGRSEDLQHWLNRRRQVVLDRRAKQAEAAAHKKAEYDAVAKDEAHKIQKAMITALESFNAGAEDRSTRKGKRQALEDGTL